MMMSAGAATADRAIFSTPKFRVGDSPVAIAAGDLNGDGILDLVTANWASDDLSIMIGRGGGLYEEEVRLPVGEGPVGLAIGDFDGDGVPDLAVTTNKSTAAIPSLVQIVLGRAEGGFEPPSIIASGTESVFVAAVDLNGDGLADLILANGVAEDLSVRLAIGGGLFGPDSRHAVGEAPAWIVAGDVNGDGRIDLVATLPDSDAVSVLLGDGSGGFGASVPYPVGDYPRGVTIADVDSDGRPDIISANRFLSDVSILSGNGDGTFAQAVTIEDSGPSQVTVAGDFDLDGRVDIAVLGDAVRVLWGRGDGTFDRPVDLVPGYAPVGLVSADLDDDGWDDLAAVNSGSDDLHLFLGGPDRGIDSVVRLAATVNLTQKVAMEDFDRDGIGDFAIIGTIRGFLDSGTSILRGREDGSYVEDDVLAAGLEPVLLDIADFNGDGIADLITSNLGFNAPGFPYFNTEGIFVRFGHGDGTFGGRIRTEPARIPSGWHIADFDGDGFIDLLFFVFDSWEIHRGDGQGHFSFLSPILPGQPLSIRGVGDMNEDGVVDLVVSIQSTASVSILPGRGGGEFDDPIGEQSIPPISLFREVLDFNGDGHLDFAFTTNSESGIGRDVALLHGLGDGTLGVPILSPVGPDIDDQKAGDMDGDGYVDLVYSVFESSLEYPDASRQGFRVFYGSEDGRFRPGGEYGVPYQRFRAQEFVIGRADRDDLPDMAVVSGSGGYLLLNRGPTPDADLDGILDREDACTDRDGDGFGDPFYPWNTCPIDNCPSQPNPSQADRDADGPGDVCDRCPNDPFDDADGDGHCGDVDRCPDVDDPGQEDSDGDGLGDACDPCTDSDGDGFGDAGYVASTCPVDNCAATPNPDQDDADDDGIGEACEVPPADDLFEDPVASVGERPQGLARGDFNGDGRVDLAVVNTGSDDVSILLGLGGGRFSAGQRIPIGQAPEGVVVGDLDLDGDEDLVFSNRDSDDLSILMGRGDGTFGSQIRMPAGNGPRRLALGDLNGDGAPDVAVAAQAALLVFLGSGDGAFTLAHQIVPGFSPAGIALGRFDADAHLDLALTHLTSNETVVYLGLGDGDFMELERHVVGRFPGPVAAADLNGDDHLDLVTANDPFQSSNMDYITVLLGSGDGTFSLQPQSILPFGGVRRPQAIIVDDLNGDSYLDVATTTFDSWSLMIHFNDGEGIFGVSPSFVGVGDDSAALVTDDFTGDGVLDIAVTRWNVDTVFIARGNGDGTFGNPSNFIGFPHSATLTVGIDDFNGDGFKDIAAPPSGTTLGEVFLGIGDGTFERGNGRSRVFQSGGDSGLFTTVADFDRDGVPDLAVANSGGRSNDAGDFGNASVHLGDGDGGFGPPVIIDADESPFALVAADFNHDGFEDLAVANASGDNITIHLGDGRGAFGPPDRYPIAPVPYWIATGDLNEDGHPDLVGASVGTGFPTGKPGGLSLLFGRGDGTFESRIMIEQGAVAAAVEIGDLDGDAHQDLVVADLLTNEVVVLLGRGDGTFGLRLRRKTGRYPIALALGDLNADRRLDVVVGSVDNRTLVVHAGAGDGSIGPGNHYGVRGSPQLINIDDLDGDHRPDLVSPLGFRIELRLNKGPFNDSDGDGTLDPDDTCTDIDGDGLGDPGFRANSCATDNCPGIANADQADLDDDGIGNVCDRCAIDPLNDADRDDVCGELDNCPETDNPDQADGDADERGDLCDNCPSAFNPDQADGNGDGSGDACQPALQLTEIREDGGETLEVIIGMSDPQGDPLSGTARIDETLRISERVLDIFDLPDCQNGFFPEGVVGEGLGYLEGDLGLPAQIFDFRDASDFFGLNCPGAANYFIAPGACDDPDLGNFRTNLSLVGLAPPVSICVVRIPFNEFEPPSDPIDVTVEHFDLVSATLARDLMAVVEGTFVDSTPSAIDISSLSTGGDHHFSLTVSDGNTIPVTVEADFLYQGEITLVFQQPPRAAIAAPPVAECDRPGAGVVTLDGRASVDPDPDGGIVRFEWFRDYGRPSQEPLGEGPMIPAVLPLGAHPIALRVTDIDGLTDVSEIEVVVQDTLTPEFSLTVDPPVLWPPNHRMVPVAVGWTVEDICDPQPGVALMETSSSEPDDAPGDGDGMTIDDIQGSESGTPDAEILLRAERSGAGGGRIYEIAYVAADASGNTAARLAIVTVPHDLGRGPEPLLMRIEPDGAPAASRIYWSGVNGAEGYDIIAGTLTGMRTSGGRVLLGEVEVLARGQPETALTVAAESGGDPPPGEARFYLVQSRDGRGGQGFGTVSVPFPREPESCVSGCP